VIDITELREYDNEDLLYEGYMSLYHDGFDDGFYDLMCVIGSDEYYVSGYNAGKDARSRMWFDGGVVLTYRGDYICLV
tara:strand:- start:397 stop:630 length:234 start_codon:yes stop_codon:yes gene_type:complete